ncbi:hypothetical protein HMPREF0381_1075 [Lachnoanaerobaculum saburreum DSM 3986]|uniref:Uncharacterized protein n=1 Tax=Lachnoanaerobaculum saburreum DSM 3986 TaxID=887325 RepID=E6LM90_9FIRM|nr:hypothetical protein HMPREF0381_1075 [Lachnoanaerobaculum saburreum DSM 3986]
MFKKVENLKKLDIQILLLKKLAKLNFFSCNGVNTKPNKT